MTRIFLALGLAGGLLAACQNSAGPTPLGGTGSAGLAEEVVRGHEGGPKGAEPDTCWGQDVTPAVVETVTEQIVVRHDSNGAVRASPVYRTETRQSIVQEREQIWFRTPCPHEVTPELVETLQRALLARGYYRGQITGRMDDSTHRAVRSFQRGQGLNSGLLSLRAARQLGLVRYDFSEG